MARLLHLLITGLVGAGIVHISVLMLIPSRAESDAFSRLARLGPEFTFLMASNPASAPILADTDPLFEMSACRFSLENGLVHARASSPVAFWSVSIFNGSGENIYSFNDRNSAGGLLDLAVGTPVQIIKRRQDLPEEFSRSIFVETESEKGMIVLRTFAPDMAAKAAADAFLASARCELIE